jgi:HD-GYP domain-containing protein (c-di-GMP phosphodiesterase class II)
MSGKIGVDELRVGMFIHLDLGWMAHPFPVGSFRIANAQQIEKIRGLGLKQLRWSPEKSELAAPSPAHADEAAPAPATAAAPAEESPQQAAERVRREQLSAQRAAAELCQRQFDEAGQAWQSAQDKVLAEPQQACRDAEDLSRSLLDKMLVDGDMCIRLLTCGAGEAAGSHAMNVAVISLLMGRVFGLGEDEMLDLGTGALMHDVGKLDLPERVRQLDERMCREDVALYRDHVAHGVAHGRRMGMRPGAMLVLAQHHENADGSGFPLRVKSDRMSIASRIVALVNRYDKLCNSPSLAQAYTPHEALSMLFAQAQSKFDTSMLNSFIRMMGVYPAGSVVQLTDDRYALVMSVNSTRPLKPNVLVHDPKLPRDEALYLNLMSAPDLGIRRSLKPSQLPADALAYLAPRPRVAYFFEAAHVGVTQAEELVHA